MSWNYIASRGQSSTTGTAGAQLYQAYIWGGTPTAAAAETATTFKFRPGEKCGAGNRALICCTYPTGTAPTISDTAGNTWPATPTAKITSAGNDTALWDLRNIAGGVFNTITITFGSATQTPSGEYWEFSGLSTSVANSGTASTSAETGASLTTGSFTPTNNNANGGNLVCAFFHDANGNDAGPTGWVAGGSFTMMQGDALVRGNFAQGQPMASEYFVQATSAPINPGMTATGDTTTQYNCIAIALPLSPGAGTPPPNQLRINKIIKQRSPNLLGATTCKTNLPATGSCRVIATTEGTDVCSAISDTDGSYSRPVGASGSFPAIFVLNGKGVDTANQVTCTLGGTSVNLDLWFFDISGAKSGTVVGATATASAATGSASSINDQPDITPTTNNSLMITSITNGLGPTLSVTSPTGAIIANVTPGGTGTGESDGGVNSGDAVAFLHNTSTSAQAWDWTLTPNNTSVASSSIEILSS